MRKLHLLLFLALVVLAASCAKPDYYVFKKQTFTPKPAGEAAAAGAGSSGR